MFPSAFTYVASDYSIGISEDLSRLLRLLMQTMSTMAPIMRTTTAATTESIIIRVSLLFLK